MTTAHRWRAVLGPAYAEMAANDYLETDPTHCAGQMSGNQQPALHNVLAGSAIGVCGWPRDGAAGVESPSPSPPTARAAEEVRRDQERVQRRAATRGLGDEPPSEVYQPSARAHPKKIKTYDYPERFFVRRLSQGGTSRVLGRQIFVSNTPQEEYVGLTETGDGAFDLRSCRIGRYDLREERIGDIVSRVPVVRERLDLASRL